MNWFKFSFLLLIGLLISSQILAETRRYRCMFSADPATTMTVGFEQYNGSSNPFDDEGTATLYYDTSPHGSNEADYAFSQGVDREVDHKGMDNKFVRLTDLTPDTRYYFIIKDDQGTSQVFFFETLSDDPTKRLSIIAGGDSRDIPILDDDIGRQNANKLVAKLRADVILFGGDMTFSDDVTSPIDLNEWPEWMDDWQLTISNDGRITPIITARGNHELNNNSIYHFFDVPNSDIYYSLSIGGGLLQTVTLNSEISRLGNQLTWLESSLSETCANWKIVQYHRPTRPHDSDKDEQDDQADNWSPLFEEHGVQLVIESDAHLCKYTYPLLRSDDAGSTEGFVRDDENGVLYIGEGGWGAELREVDDAKDWTMAHETANQFKWIFVDQDNIEIRTINTDNADSVTPKTDIDDKFSMPNNIDVWNPTITDAAGVTSYNSGVLTLNNPTNPILDLGEDFEIDFVNGATTTLDAGTEFDSYLWNTGETTSSIEVSMEGNYSVTIVKNGCTLTDNIEMGQTLSINQLDSEKYQFSVSPNPAKGFISAQISSTEYTNMILKLVDMSGKLLREKNVQLSAGDNKVDFLLSDISSGMYFMVLEQDGAVLVEKFVVSK
jgi:hypothetical protein